MTSTDQEQIEAIRSRGRCCEDRQVQRDIRWLISYIEDLQSEIHRHHVDFEKWEAMAAAGAGKVRIVEDLMIALAEMRLMARDCLSPERIALEKETFALADLALINAGVHNLDGAAVL